MTNFGNMQSRIAEELNRYDLDEFIPKAIYSAIQFYENEPLGFNEDTYQATNNEAQECLHLPENIQKVLALHILSDGQSYKVKYKPHFDFFHGFGFPKFFTPHHHKIVLAPIPHKPLRFQVTYLAKAPKLVKKTDANFWMNEGEELIRSRAKANLYMHILREYQDGKIMKEMEKEILTKFKSERNDNEHTGYLQATSF